MIKSFTDLDAWKEGHKLVEIVYEITAKYPNEEKYNLISQSRRAVVSVTNNLAEGFGRFHYRDRLIFYYNARGSLLEVQNCLLAARDTHVLKSSHDFQRAWDQSEICYQKVNGFISSTTKRIS